MVDLPEEQMAPGQYPTEGERSYRLNSRPSILDPPGRARARSLYRFLCERRVRHLGDRVAFTSDRDTHRREQVGRIRCPVTCIAALSPGRSDSVSDSSNRDFFIREPVLLTCNRDFFIRKSVPLTRNRDFFSSDPVLLTCDRDFFRSDPVLLTCDRDFFSSESVLLTCDRDFFSRDPVLLTCDRDTFSGDPALLTCDLATAIATVADSLAASAPEMVQLSSGSA
jgi:hypothetical protein